MNSDPIKVIILKSVLQEVNHDLSPEEQWSAKYLKKYDLHAFETLAEPNIPASVKRYRKLLKKYNTDSDIKIQNVIDEFASKFDSKFCNNNLLNEI